MRQTPSMAKLVTHGVLHGSLVAPPAKIEIIQACRTGINVATSINVHFVDSLPRGSTIISIANFHLASDLRASWIWITRGGGKRQRVWIARVPIQDGPVKEFIPTRIQGIEHFHTQSLAIAAPRSYVFRSLGIKGLSNSIQTKKSGQQQIKSIQTKPNEYKCFQSSLLTSSSANSVGSQIQCRGEPLS